MVPESVFITALNFFGPLKDFPSKCSGLIEGGFAKIIFMIFSFFYGDLSSDELNNLFRGAKVGSYLFQFRKGFFFITLLFFQLTSAIVN